MQLLETIRFESGKFLNTKLHQKRLNFSRKILFNCTKNINLESALANSVVQKQNQQLLKCRVIYDTKIRSVEFIPYKIPNVKSLKLIVCNEIEYNFKYKNRDAINKLMTQKNNADDIIIIKNGLITDSSFANLIFYNGEQWLTPADPLLKGIQRAKLLDQKRITTAEIRPLDLINFTKVRLINAMLQFEDEVDVLLDNIH